MSDKIKIELNYEEAEVFKWCWKHYSIFKEAIRVLRPGKLILNMNGSGDVKPEFHLIGKESVEKLEKIGSKVNTT